MTTFNESKFIKARTFNTALKQLSKMVQKNDGDIFCVSDILDNIKNKINADGKNYKIFANNHQYYDYHKNSDGTYFRLQIELNYDSNTYISCGYSD